MWTLRIRHGGTSRMLKDVDPSTSVGSLKQRIGTIIGVAPEEIQIRASFPPKPVTADDDSSVQGSGIGNMETLVVTAESASPVRGLAKLISKAQESEENSSSSTQSHSASASGSSPTDASIFDKLSNDLVSQLSKKEGANDLRAFRTSLKKALEGRQQERLATHRLKAALDKSFTIEDTPGLQTLAATIPHIRVTFHAGRRAPVTEEYMKLPKPLLAVLVAQIAKDPDFRDNLKPINMALVSPRVFWNLARIYQGDIEGGLQQLLPDVDWDFLAQRTRTMTEKALENERQKQSGEYAQLEDLTRGYDKDGKKRKKTRPKQSQNSVGTGAPEHDDTADVTGEASASRTKRRKKADATAQS